MRNILFILLCTVLFYANGQTYDVVKINGTGANSSGNVTISSANIDTQSLHLNYSDSIRLSITRGNYVAFAYAIDSVGQTASGDSMIVYKGGARYAYVNGSLTFGLNAGRDSFILVHNGVRWAVRDSIGSAGGSGWSLSGNNVADDSTNFIGTTDNQSLPFYTNNAFAMKLTTNKQLALGLQNPSTMFHAKSQGLNGSYAGYYTFESHQTNSKLSGWVEPSDSGAVHGLNTYMDNGTWRSAQAVGSWIKSSRTGLFIFTSNGNTIGGAYTPDATKGIFIAASDGSVNIGTQTNYTYPLSVYKSVNSIDGFYILNPSTGTGAGASLGMFNGTVFNNIFTGSTGHSNTLYRSAIVYNSTGATGHVFNTSNGSAPYLFLQNGSERLRVDANGSVGVGVGASNNASAILQANSTSKGFLMPVMSGAQAEAISSPATGLLVYANNGDGVTITSTGWWGYNGASWVKLN